MINSTEGAKNLVNKLLVFSRGSKQSDETISVHKAVTDFIDMCSSVVPSSIAIHTDLSTDDLSIEFDETSINQILMNLCINARDAIAESGEINIVTALQYVSDLECDSCRQMFEGYYVKLSVSDNGDGFSLESKRKIFDPFYSSKDVGKGTGMGLPVVHGLVHGANGHLCVNSEVGKGSCFELYFPVASKSANKIFVPEEDSHELVLSKIDIVIVDDVKDIAEFVKGALDSSGANITIYSSAEKFVSDFNDGLLAMDILITDITMPKYSGIQLARIIKNSIFDCEVIAMSGYSDKVNQSNYVDLGFSAYLSKPIDCNELEKAIMKLDCVNTDDAS